MNEMISVRVDKVVKLDYTVEAELMVDENTEQWFLLNHMTGKMEPKTVEELLALGHDVTESSVS